MFLQHISAVGRNQKQRRNRAMPATSMENVSMYNGPIVASPYSVERGSGNRSEVHPIYRGHLNRVEDIYLLASVHCIKVITFLSDLTSMRDMCPSHNCSQESSS